MTDPHGSRGWRLYGLDLGAQNGGEQEQRSAEEEGDKSKLETRNSKFETRNSKLETRGIAGEFRISNFGFRLPGEPRNAERKICGIPCDFRFSSFDFRVSISEFRFSSFDFRVSIFEFRLLLEVRQAPPWKCDLPARGPLPESYTPEAWRAAPTRWLQTPDCEPRRGSPPS